jgi:hypothetical protein
MKLYAIAATLGLLTNISTINVLPTDTNVAFQTITVPDYSLTFERGTYEIIEMSYTAKTQLSDSQLTSILKQAGFSGNGLKMAKAIAFHESTNRPMALNKYSNCYGLFQINMSGSMGENRREKYGLNSNKDLFNPLINAQIAYQMSNRGSNWTAWSTNSLAKKSISD